MLNIDLNQAVQDRVHALAQAKPRFQVAGSATIKHLNVRKEGDEDNKEIAVDVKLLFSDIDRALCAYFDEALEAFLWRGDSDMLAVRNSYLAPLAYANDIEGATVEIGMHNFMPCDVRKFAIEPHDGGVVSLSCSVSFFPTADEVASLARLVQGEERVSITGPADLFA